jgi:hypothetical protein
LLVGCAQTGKINDAALDFQFGASPSFCWVSVVWLTRPPWGISFGGCGAGIDCGGALILGTLSGHIARPRLHFRIRFIERSEAVLPDQQR